MEAQSRPAGGRMSVVERALASVLIAFVVVLVLVLATFWWVEHAGLERYASALDSRVSAALAEVRSLKKQDPEFKSGQPAAKSREVFAERFPRSFFLNLRGTVQLSALDSPGWKLGQTFAPPEQEAAFKKAKDSAGHRFYFLTDQRELVLMKWEEDLGAVGCSLEAGPLLATLRLARLVCLGVVILGFALCAALVYLTLNRRMRKPARAFGEALKTLAGDGQLGGGRRRLADLRQRYKIEPRHELDGPLASATALIISLEQIVASVESIAADRLTDAGLRDGARGDIADRFRAMHAFLSQVSETLEQASEQAPAFVLEREFPRAGAFGRSFHLLQERCQHLVERLFKASNRLEESVTGLQATATAQASTAAKQADGVTETMATMEELAASSGHIADTAKHVVAIAEETLESARIGQEAFVNVGKGMEDIVKASQRGAERLGSLDEKSRSIGRVATLIASVAEQSKILALNAAIEAAHAGEAGKGFSVVAEEVRNLAEHVVESTREIEDLITDIQEEIRQARDASKDEVQSANTGRDLARNAGETIVSLFSSAKKMTQAAHQIELATNQQRSASGQVATAVREMASSAEEVAHGARLLRGSFNELADLAKELQEVVVTLEEPEAIKAEPTAEAPR